MASPKPSFVVDSPKVQYNDQKSVLLAAYDYQTTKVSNSPDGKTVVTPVTQTLTFKTNCKVPRLGCMLVGWGGNNGSTLTASVLANKLKVEWRTKDGTMVSCGRTFRCHDIELTTRSQGCVSCVVSTCMPKLPTKKGHGGVWH